MGLDAAIAAAKGCAEQKESSSAPAGSVGLKGPEEVIDLLSGDEADETSVSTLVVLDDGDTAMDCTAAEGASVPGPVTSPPSTSSRNGAQDTVDRTVDAVLATGEAGPVDGIPVNHGDNRDSKGPADGSSYPKLDIGA